MLTGVDFYGPILIKTGIRKTIPVKIYIAIFVCLVTRAMYLETVSTLTTGAFLSALVRFMCRRGFASHLYSDNATNFIGTDRLLQSFLKDAKTQYNLQLQLADIGVQWHFIPPVAPHFGGIWEAVVKSAKRHMLKITKGSL